MAQEAWRAYLELAYGMTEATTKKATKTVRRLVGKSGATAEQLQAMAEDLLKAGSNNREALTKLVRYELDRALGAVGLATADEVAALTTRVHELEAQLKEATTAPAPEVEPAPVAKRTVAKKVAEPVGAEVVAKRTVAKKAVAPVTPPPAKRVPVKKSAPARKVAAKAAIDQIAEASEVGPASDRLPVKKATRAPRKTTS